MVVVVAADALPPVLQAVFGADLEAAVGAKAEADAAVGGLVCCCCCCVVVVVV